MRNLLEITPQMLAAVIPNGLPDGKYSKMLVARAVLTHFTEKFGEDAMEDVYLLAGLMPDDLWDADKALSSWRTRYGWDNPDWLDELKRLAAEEQSSAG